MASFFPQVPEEARGAKEVEAAVGPPELAEAVREADTRLGAGSPHRSR
jgi:hypothetical protein